MDRERGGLLLLDVILPTENEYYKQQAAGLIYYSKAIPTNIKYYRKGKPLQVICDIIRSSGSGESSDGGAGVSRCPVQRLLLRHHTRPWPPFSIYLA